MYQDNTPAIHYLDMVDVRIGARKLYQAQAIEIGTRHAALFAEGFFPDCTLEDYAQNAYDTAIAAGLSQDMAWDAFNHCMAVAGE